MSDAKATATAYDRHFYSLDILRGVAALAVVIYHWPHFFYVGTEAGHVDMKLLPLSFILMPVYVEGWRVVDLFFCLSGFIFFWLYSEKIAAGVTSLKEFAVLRFSRLYPLHFVTLLFVAIGQVCILHYWGSYFVYPNNDPFHFLLQLGFISNWGFEKGYSFNGPIWSVSVEVFLYVLFFILCALRCHRWWHLLLLIYFGHFLLEYNLPEMSRGVISFFAGGLSYKIFRLLWSRGLSAGLLTGLVVLTVLLWLVIPVASYRYEPQNGTYADGQIVNQDLAGHLMGRLAQNGYELFLFPVTILTLATGEAYRGTLGRRFSFVGNISYSVYLLHFPLQLSVVSIARSLAVPEGVFLSPWIMLAFYCLLIPLALASYNYFERPLQKTLRAKLLGSSKSPAEKRN